MNIHKTRDKVFTTAIDDFSPGGSGQTRRSLNDTTIFDEKIGCFRAGFIGYRASGEEEPAPHYYLLQCHTNPCTAVMSIY